VFVDVYDKIITDFVKGKLNIAKKRLYTRPEHGGLGLFNINDFLEAQRSTWIKRSTNLNETWKIVIYLCNFGNVFNSKSSNLNISEYPICHGICSSFEKICNNFTTVNENYKQSYIFENAKFTLDLFSRECVNRTHFTNEFFNNNAYKLFQLKYSDFYTDDGVVIDDMLVRESTGINFNALQLFRIRGACSTAKIRYKKHDINMQKGVNIVTFLHRRKRGSSHLRKLAYPTVPETIPHNINKFSDNLDIVITLEQSKYLNSLWTNSMFTSKERTFFFKLHNNTLGYNVSVAHFVRGHSPFCTFCDLAGSQEQNRETPLHIFYDCNCISTIIERVYQRLTNNPDFMFSRREYFATFDRRELSYAKNTILTIVGKLLIFYIWDCRNRNYLPGLENCWYSIKDRISILCNTNRNFNKLWESSGLQNNLP
jgi:nitrate reductase cytochrome c-type subunit